MRFAHVGRCILGSGQFSGENEESGPEAFLLRRSGLDLGPHLPNRNALFSYKFYC